MHSYQRNRGRFRAQLRFLEDGVRTLMRKAWSLITGWCFGCRPGETPGRRYRGIHGRI